MTRMNLALGASIAVAVLAVALWLTKASPSANRQTSPQIAQTRLQPHDQSAGTSSQTTRAGLPDILSNANAADSQAEQADRDEVNIVALPDGGTLHIVGEPTPSRPGALSVTDLVLKDKAAMDAIQDGLGPDSKVFQAQDQCFEDWMNRPHTPLKGRNEWLVRVHVVSRGGKATIAEASVINDDDWPPIFDAQLKVCLLEKVRAMEAKTAHDFEYTLDFPFCIYGPDMIPGTEATNK